MLQTLFAKIQHFSEYTFILHVFLAEWVYILTFIDELTSHLAKSWFQLKEKQSDSWVVDLGLSLDFLIYIIR